MKNQKVGPHIATTAAQGGGWGAGQRMCVLNWTVERVQFGSVQNNTHFLTFGSKHFETV